MYIRVINLVSYKGISVRHFPSILIILQAFCHSWHVLVSRKIIALSAPDQYPCPHSPLLASHTSTIQQSKKMPTYLIHFLAKYTWSDSFDRVVKFIRQNFERWGRAYWRVACLLKYPMAIYKKNRWIFPTLLKQKNISVKHDSVFR